MLKAPDPVRSPQLSNIWTSQYYGGGPHGNTGCCSFCNFFVDTFNDIFFIKNLCKEYSSFIKCVFFFFGIRFIQITGYDGHVYDDF